MGAWDDYLLCNSAVAEAFFPETDESKGVYLDFEEESVRRMAAALGIAEGVVEAKLVASVRATLSSNGGRQLFSRHQTSLRTWQARPGYDPDCPPPIIGVLGVFTLAAERMRRGDGLSSNNYYGRLVELLGSSVADVQSAYRTVAESFWSALGDWLTGIDGARGLPTVAPYRHRHVGLSISQALIRDVDRDRLSTFFMESGLPAGSQVLPGELELALEQWIMQPNCPVTLDLRTAWTSKDGRQQICAIVASALETWNGTASRAKDSPHAADVIGLSLSLGRFPKKRVSLSALAFFDEPTVPRNGTVLSTDQPQSIELLAGIQSALNLGQAGDLDHGSLLEGVLSVEDSLTGRIAERRPRRVVAFRQDQLSHRWIEASRGVMRGEELILLVRTELVDSLVRVLEACARPGWGRLPETYIGMPDGWSAYRGVEIYNSAKGLVDNLGKDFAVLEPVTTSNLAVSGGMSLPGLARNRWHVWATPEVRLVSDDPEGCRLRLIDGATGDVMEEVLGSEGLAVLDLNEYELEEGQYRVEGVASDGTTLATREIQLCSGDTPDERQWATAVALHRPLDSARAVLSAEPCPADLTADELGAGRAVSAKARRAGLWMSTPPNFPHWQRATRSAALARRQMVKVGIPADDSCVYTGEHRIHVEDVPTDSLGRALVPNSTGQCTECGLRVRYPTHWWRIRQRSKQMKEVRVSKPYPLGGLGAKRVAEVSDVDWETGLDALMHTGGGAWSLFERIAAQIEPSALFCDRFARSLESLGHMEIERDPGTLRPVRWDMTPPTLCHTMNGYLLAGLWTGERTRLLQDSVELELVENEEGPDSWFASSLPDSSFSRDETGRQTWQDVATYLPALSAVVEELPVRRAHVDGQVRWFDCQTAQWVDAKDLAEPGAYRMNRFTTLDVLLTEEDLRAGTMRVGQVQLNKHAAALIAGDKPLMFYDDEAMRLAVPLGADLPGLYERAVVMASGLLPVADNGLLVYFDVPPELAAHIYHLLSH